MEIDLRLLIIFSYLLFGINCACYCQDQEKGKRIYYQVQASFVQLTEASNARFRPGIGSQNFDIKTNNSRAFSFNSSLGYFVVPGKLSLGMSIGLDRYFDPSYNVMPVSFDFRYSGLEQVKSLYLFFQLSKPLVVHENFEKGHGGKLGAGYKIRLSQRLHLVTEVGITSFQLYPSKISDVLLRGVAFTIGILFL